MRTYYAHLESIHSPQHKILPAKPIFRSSAIFPVIHSSFMTSRLLFMGYWVIKRRIQEISCVLTLRSLEGEALYRENFTVNQAKGFCIELKEILSTASFIPPHFEGSLEIEFFSNVHLVFPFPAVVINYYGQHFSTVVHTAQRVYNDFEDKKNNSEARVPEAGFNFYLEEGFEPFFAIINGCEGVEKPQFEFNFYNEFDQSQKFNLNFDKLNPYETLFIYPKEQFSLQNLFSTSLISAKIKFSLNWIFPRLIVGNKDKKNETLSITHSYYDCTERSEENDYWIEKSTDFHIASLMVPLNLQGNNFTNIYFYPIYSPSTFQIDLEIFNAKGELLFQKERVLLVQSPSEQLLKVNFKELVDISLPNEMLAARLIAKSVYPNEKIPARIKLGLDIGEKEHLPCNICTNLQPYNPSLATKIQTFRWGPILADQPFYQVLLMNTSPAKAFKKESTIHVIYYREKDHQTLERTYCLPPNGFYCLEKGKDSSLDNFLEGKVGWYTAVSDNPYFLTYYFCYHPSGAWGGDHGF